MPLPFHLLLLLSRCLLLFLLSWPMSVAAASPELVLNNQIAAQRDALKILDYAVIMEDPSSQLTLEDVLLKQSYFGESGAIGGQLDLFMTPSAYWFRTIINNQSDKENWYFVVSGSLSRHVEIYLKEKASKGPFIRQQILPYSRMKQYQLSLMPKQQYELYFRVQDKQAPIYIAPRLNSSTQILADIMLTYPIYSFVIGGLLTLALYNLLYFLYLRDRSFLALSVFIFSFVLEVGNHSGLWSYFNFFREYMAGMGAMFGLIAISATISMTCNWLGVRDNLPRMYLLLKILFWACLVLVPVQWWLGHGTVIVGSIGLLLIPPFLSVTFLRYRQGFHYPIMLRASVFLMLLAFIPSLLRGAGLIGDVRLLTDGMYFILLIALLMLSLTQAEQVRTKSEHAERIAASNKAKDQFLTTMSHELRTPMNAVVSSGRLLEHTPLYGEQKEYVSRLNTSSDHMLELINDILDLARLDSSLLNIETIPLKLDKVLQQVNQLLSEQAHSKSLKLTLDNRFHSINKQLLSDPTRLQQILLNLLGNAIKFTEHGEVSLKITPLDVTANTVRLLFEVKDTGLGMKAEQHKKLFQPFLQADNSTTRKYGGSGLGLAISQKLVGLMGGELKVDSELGVGSRFFFSLDFDLQDPEVEPIQMTPEYSSLPEGFHVLLVDDDEMNRFFGKKLLAHLKVNVDVAESGEEAIQMLDKQAFDLVFMDVSMPGMDGYETTRSIRQDGRYKDLLIVALTAHAIVGERERCIAVGMNDYLSKPFEFDDIKQILTRLSA